MKISDRLDKVVEGRSQVFLLDLSWFLHRNYNTFRWMNVDVNGYKRPTGHIYGVLYTVATLKTKYPNCAIIVCQDGIPVERQELYASQGTVYKDGREDLEFNFYKDIPSIELLCYLTSRVFWAYNEDKESDDLMYALAKQIEEISDCDVLIYSGDNDLLQAVDDQVRVVRKTDKSGNLIEISNLEITTDKVFTNKFYGTDSFHLPYFRAIVGDPSDSIKGVVRFPRKLAHQIAMSCNEFDDMFKFQGVTTNEKKYCALLEEEQEKVRVNYQMMKLSADFNVKLSRKKPDIQRALGLIEEFQLSKYKRFLQGKE